MYYLSVMKTTIGRKPTPCNPEETCPSQGSGRMERGKGGESSLVGRDTPIVLSIIISTGSTERVAEQDDIFFDGEVYHRFVDCETNGIYLISCEKGYTHDITSELLSKMKFSGKFQGNEKLFECD